MKKFLLIFALTPMAYGQSTAGVLSANRSTDWTQAGIPGGIPSGPWLQCGPTIGAYTGTSATIINALNHTGVGYTGCSANTYVKLGVGTFNLSYATTGIFFPALSITGVTPGTATMELPFYTEATNHSGKTTSGRALASGAPSKIDTSFNWLPTSGAAITRIDFTVADATNFATNCHFIVWAVD